MGSERQIKPVKDNTDKQRTYREHKGRYKRAMENEFYFEALLIDYALLEDRLRAIIYHMGFLKDRTAFRIWKKKHACLQEIISLYQDTTDSCQISIRDISGKIKIIRNILLWAANSEDNYQQDRHLSTLKSRCQELDVDTLLLSLNQLHEWCAYRNEVIHGLMNKNLESLSGGLKSKVEEGMLLASFFDNQEKHLKKGNKIRKSANLQMN